MLECILYQRYIEQWQNLDIWIFHVEIHIHGGAVGAAEFHQGNVVVHKLDFALNGYKFGVGFVEGVTQKAAQSAEVFLRLVGVGVYLTRNIVERIEKKMRVELVFEPGEFRLGLFVFAFFFCYKLLIAKFVKF